MIGKMRTAALAALLLAAGNSWALGLGQIQVKSKLNQPLLAEIPIISTTPGELAALKARLASPDTFRRVGLPPPTGAAADLQFSLGSDAKGRPIIRVTTLKPVEQSMLDFLIEVDWGNGKLVREYTALVGSPNTASAPVQADVQMAQTAAPNQVQRPTPAPVPVSAAPVAVAPAVPPSPPQPASPAAPAEVGVVIAPLPESKSADTAVAVAPVAKPAPSVVQPQRTPAKRVQAPQPVATGAPQQRVVKRGESLSKIASSLDLRRSFSLEQTMLALQQVNPDAFAGGNINRLRSGSVLRLPDQDEVAKISAEEAAQLVHQQTREWRQRRAVRQPDSAHREQPSVAQTKQATAKTEPSKPLPAKPTPAKPAKPAVSAAQAAGANTVAQGARLQIVPPAAQGKATGMKSGTAAGSEGSMLQQELRQKDEDIAAKTAEIGELKERVAALEKLKDEQQQLISLKDTELAAAQQRLAEANKAAQSAPAAQVKQTQPVTEQPAPTQVKPYVWGGIGVVVLALLAWLLKGKKKQKPAPRRSVFDSADLAASMAPAKQAPAPADNAVATVPSFAQALEAAADEMTSADAVPDVAANTTAAVENATVAPHDDAVSAVLAPEPAPTLDLSNVPATPSGVTMPAWQSGWVSQVQSAPTPSVSQPEPPAQEAVAAVPTPEAVEPAVAMTEATQTVPSDADVEAQATPEQRFKLAHAFLDMGDEYSAQQILLDLLDHEDAAVGAEAAKVLSKLVG